MKIAPISAEVIAATRPIYGMCGYGLLTIKVECPLYVWTELLTHRRFARNASSARAMSTDRYAGMGHYMPDVFVKQGKGMASSAEPIKYQRLAELIWKTTINVTNLSAKLLEKLGTAKEQRNRLIAPTKIVRGIVTGTEAAWEYFLLLRDNKAADRAMQELAHNINIAMNNAKWDYAYEHLPMYPHGDTTLSHMDKKLVAVARIARVSYAREKGKEDLQLAKSLMEEGHYSPFEHMAAWKLNPRNCAYSCTPQDLIKTTDLFPMYWGWETWRYDAGQ